MVREAVDNNRKSRGLVAESKIVRRPITQKMLRAQTTSFQCMLKLNGKVMVRFNVAWDSALSHAQVKWCTPTVNIVKSAKVPSLKFDLPRFVYATQNPHLR